MPSSINQATAALLEQRLDGAGIRLTFGGEPTYVPVTPEGAEWSVAADGPTKLRYAKALGRELAQRVWPGSTLIYCPGKRYDGEVNPPCPCASPSIQPAIQPAPHSRDDSLEGGPPRGLHRGFAPGLATS